jgi:hypothetical protein
MQPISSPAGRSCPDCAPINRRAFLKSSAIAGAAVAALPSPWLSQRAAAAPRAENASETLVASLYKSLDEKQRGSLCFAFEDPLRQKVDNNWHIVQPRVDEILSRDQQQMVREIFLGLHSEEYAQDVLGATEHDNGERGLGACSIALFGEPGTGKFEFVLSGRHVTRRCDGDSVEGAAFGGPIFYGHAALSDSEAPDHPGNIYWFQARRANEVFSALDGGQRALALRDRARPERGTETVRLKGVTTGLEGIPLSELSADQRELVRKVMADLLAPFRPADAREALKLVEAAGFEQLHMAFFKQGDIGADGVWDIWQLEGPGMIWYFRGSPHVHTWVNIAQAKPA